VGIESGTWGGDVIETTDFVADEGPCDCDKWGETAGEDTVAGFLGGDDTGTVFFGEETSTETFYGDEAWGETNGVDNV
jgi:hypothetical protein